MSGRPMLYAFPDDGDATLDTILGGLPEERSSAMIVRGSGLSQLRLTDLTAATYLALRLKTKDRRTESSSTHPYTLTVADEARTTCEAYLKDLDSRAVWQPLIIASFFNEPSQDDFDEAWRRLAGPHLV